LQFILRDWDRLWYLATVDGAAPQSDALAAGPALRVVASLLRHEANLQVIRGLLQTEYPFAGRPISNQGRALLPKIEARFHRRSWALLPGPEIDLRAALTKSTRVGAGRTQTLRIFDFNTGDFAEASGSARPAAADARDAIPALRFSGGHERTEWLSFRHGSEREPGLALAHESGNGPVPEFALATEGGPSLGFTHATEPARDFGASVTETAPA
jgi:hypothetical protein